ncbi:GNAT family N-acetyltransferase [Paenibacillus sp. GSMTC-2017]|uniref:GNAT family N-acetyltransferase n=1 Tax=Paenibacillus sp. GSMTC-2017 TaxID=2794350 RepID=UPI0018D83305|nr:GNAT family N-acetyltransferase [Paenibacillus sp. GSMTC-2017]MBH5316231.1 GNAT family N-acetyltransferase [Paenibacillus sp. GSMTC-2017]
MIRLTTLVLETARKVEKSETNALFSRLNTIRNMEGNPNEVHIEHFGNTTAFIAKGIPDPYFNSVRGFTFADIELLDPILEFYRNHNVKCRMDIAPFDVEPELLIRLSERGYYQYGFHTALYRKINIPLPQTYNKESLVIRKLREDEFGLFGEIYTKGFGMSDFLSSAIAKNNQVLYHVPGWHFYLATYNNSPAAIAVLNVQDGIGSFAAATTLPDFRGRGCQTALLEERLKDAAELDCELVVSQSRFGSVSQSNMERVGMRIAYTKSLWKEISK